MNRVRQPHTLLVLGLNAEMGTTAGADELVNPKPSNRIGALTKRAQDAAATNRQALQVLRTLWGHISFIH